MIVLGEVHAKFGQDPLKCNQFLEMNVRNKKKYTV